MKLAWCKSCGTSLSEQVAGDEAAESPAAVTVLSAPAKSVRIPKDRIGDFAFHQTREELPRSKGKVTLTLALGTRATAERFAACQLSGQFSAEPQSSTDPPGSLRGRSSGKRSDKGEGEGEEARVRDFLEKEQGTEEGRCAELLREKLDDVKKQVEAKKIAWRSVLLKVSKKEASHGEKLGRRIAPGSQLHKQISDSPGNKLANYPRTYMDPASKNTVRRGHEEQKFRTSPRTAKRSVSVLERSKKGS